MKTKDIFSKSAIEKSFVLTCEKNLKRSKRLRSGWNQRGLLFRWILSNRKKVIQNVLGQFRVRDYRFSEIEVKEVMLDKGRKLFKYHPLDECILDFVANYLNSIAEKNYSENLFSYRKDFSNKVATRKLSEFMERHNCHLNPKSRELFVLRFDVKSYSDSIPLHSNSPLWSLLQELICPNENGLFSEGEYLFELLKDALCAARVFKANTLQSTNTENTVNTVKVVPEIANIGLPTGTRILNVLLNIYLQELDSKMTDFCKNNFGFYGRYGDDIVVVVSAIELCNVAEKIVRNVVESLELKLNETKFQRIYLTANGCKKEDKKLLQYLFMQRFEFLGFALDIFGNIYLTDKKRKVLNRTFQNSLKEMTTENAAICLKSENGCKSELFSEIIFRLYSQYCESFHHLTDLKTFGRIGEKGVREFQSIVSDIAASTYGKIFKQNLSLAKKKRLLWKTRKKTLRKNRFNDIKPSVAEPYASLSAA